MFSFKKITKATLECKEASNKLCSDFLTDERLSGIVVIYPCHMSYCFRMQFLPDTGHGLSISYPPDTNMMDEPPSTIETLLLKVGGKGEDIYNKSTKFVNNESCEYDRGPKRFYNIDDVVGEIIRLANFISSPEFKEDGAEDAEDA